MRCFLTSNAPVNVNYKLLLTFLNRNDQPGHLLLKEMLINRLYLFAANTFSDSLSNAVANFMFFFLYRCFQALLSLMRKLWQGDFSSLKNLLKKLVPS